MTKQKRPHVTARHDPDAATASARSRIELDLSDDFAIDDESPTRSIDTVAFAPSAALLAVAAPSRTVVFDARSRVRVHELDCPGAENLSFGWEVAALVFSPDSRELLVVLGGGQSSLEYSRASLFDLQSGSFVADVHPESTDDGAITAAVFSPDGVYLATCCGGRVHVADARATGPTRLLAHGSLGARLAWSGDGTRLAVLAQDGRLREFAAPTFAPGATDAVPTPTTGRVANFLALDAAGASYLVAYGPRAWLCDRAQRTTRPCEGPPGGRIVWASPDLRSVLWTTSDGGLVRQRLPGGSLHRIARRRSSAPRRATAEHRVVVVVSPDGHRVARATGHCVTLSRLATRRA